MTMTARLREAMTTLMTVYHTAISHRKVGRKRWL
jgi:hypothetical protein